MAPPAPAPTYPTYPTEPTEPVPPLVPTVGRTGADSWRYEDDVFEQVFTRLYGKMTWDDKLRLSWLSATLFFIIGARPVMPVQSTRPPLAAPRSRSPSPSPSRAVALAEA